MRVVVGEHEPGVWNFDMRVIDLDGWGDEDEVNLMALEGRNLAELVESVGCACVVGRHVVGIVHSELVRRHCGIGFVVLRYVEIARYNCGLFANNLLNLLHDELCTLPSSRYANVVEMRIDCHEDFASLLVFELCITRYAFEGCVPTLRTWNLRRFAQPEIAFLQNLELVFEEEDRRVFSLRRTIGPPYSNVVVLGHEGKQILELSVQNFLHSHDIDVVPLNVVGHSVLSNIPTIAGLIVAIVLQANVERAPTKFSRLLLLGRKTHHWHDKCE